jgi:citrate lyase synthetase
MHDYVQTEGNKASCHVLSSQYRVTRFASCSDFVHYIFVTEDSSLLPATYYINLWIVELRYILIEYTCVATKVFVFSRLVSGTFQQYHIILCR